MPSEIATSKVSLSTKPTESRWLAIANLPETATEDTIKECFKRHGRVQSVKIDEQRFAFVAFLDVRTASKAHNAENILDEQRLRTAFHDGSNSVPKALLGPPPLPIQSSSSSSIVLPEQPSLLTSSTVIEASSSSSSNTSNITTVTNPLPTKTINGDRDKRPSRTLGSPDENVRHQVVPVKRDSDSSGSKRKTSSTSVSKTTNSSHSTIQKPPRRKHDNSSSSSSSSSSSESERSSDDSISCKNRRRNPTKTHSLLNDSMSKTKILKIYHLPSKTPKDSLRELLWEIFVEFKKSCRLLTVKIDGEHESRYALLTFRKSEDVDKALTFATTKTIYGVKIKAEPYDGIPNETDECDIMKRSICTDPDFDEYSIKATRTLYIGNLQSEISYNELREIYSAYGDIIEVEIKRQTQSQHQLPFAFVQYADIKSVVKAMKAFEPKTTRDHSIKLGFGKSQPTNVLWLDELPLTVTESSIRNFIIRQTNLAADQVLDIYIDNRNSHKSQTAQCLIYFFDTRAAQEAINSIRGKKIDSKRIQVDFASKVFVTRFSDIIEETSHKKNYVGYPPDSTYHGESRSVSKRNGTTREIVPETIQTFDTSSTRTNSSDRWSNAYNNSNRPQHKSDSRHSSDRRHSKEYGKGTSTSLISIPSVDNGTMPNSSLNTRRHRLSTSSKDSLSNNNLSSGRNPHRSSHPRHQPSSTSSSSSRSGASSSTHSSSSTNRSNSYQKHSTTKHSQKSSKKPSKYLTNNLKTSSTTGKKSSTNKEHSTKSSHHSRSVKSEKDNDSSTIIPPQQQQQLQLDPVILPSLTVEDPFESTKKESSPPKQQQQQQQTPIPSSSSSPKAPLKNTERVFDWLMQNHHHDSNSSMGLDQNDDDEHLLKRKPDDDSLENVSDEQTSKTSPPIQTNNTTLSTCLKSSTSMKNCKNEKSILTSAYRLQPIRTGSKRDDQMENSSANELHLSPPPPSQSSIPPVSTPTPSLTKDDVETHIVHRRIPPTKYHLSARDTKIIPLDSNSSYDQLDVRLKSYPSLFNDHVDLIRLPFPQFAFEHIKTSTTSSNVLVVLNPKAHLKHSSLGLNNPSSTINATKHETSIDTNLSNITNTTISTSTTTTTITSTTNNNDDELSTTRIPLDERIRLLDKQMYEMNHGQQKSTTSSSSSSSSSSLSPATLIEQQNQKIITASSSSSAAAAIAPITTVPIMTAATTINTNTAVKSVTELVSTLSATSSSSQTLAQCIQAARAAALNAQPTQSISPSKTTPTISTSSPFHFPVTSVPSLNLNRPLSTTAPSPIHIPSVLAPPPPPPPPPPFPNLSRLSDASSNSILTFHAAIAQTQMAAAAAAKYSPMSFATTLHPPPPPVPASLISPSLNLNSPITPTPTLNNSSNNNNNNNNLISTLKCSSPSLPNRSTPTNLLSPPVSNISSQSSFSDSIPSSPSTSSAKILERLGPSAKFKRKPIPPPLAVITTPTTPTNNKDSPILPSPESTTPTNTGTNSPVTVSSPALQHQLSTSSSVGLKSILKQRSLSNASSASALSPTNERKSSTNYVSPLASNEVRAPLQVTSTTTNRSASTDSVTKRTPPTTPTVPTEKKKSLNQQDSSVFTNDIDERQAAAAAAAATAAAAVDEKKSTWRAPPTKQTLSNETVTPKKPTLDKIPKKPSATPKPTVTEPVKQPPKVIKTTATVTATTTTTTTTTTKQAQMTSLGSKVPQLTLERIDPKNLKPSVEMSGKSINKSIKIKRTNVIQSDSDSEKKSSTTTDVQKTKKSLLNNEITKRKQQHQHQQKPLPTTKKPQLTKPTKIKTPSTVRKLSTTETHSSSSEDDEKKTEHTTTASDHDQASSDNDEKSKKDSIKKRTKTTNKNKLKSTSSRMNWRDLRQDTSMYDRIKKRARSEQTRNSSMSTSEDFLSDENSNEDDDDDDNEKDEDDDHPISSRPTNMTSRRHNVMSDSSDSEEEEESSSSKSKTKKSTVFDNNVFDAEESDDNNKSINRKKKVTQQQPQQQSQSQQPQQQQIKKPILKTNNEPIKKEKLSKNNDESSNIKKKMITSKVTDKKKPIVSSTKSISKPTKTTTSAQKRPSTDESNESTKKLKLDDDKSKTITTTATSSTIEEQPLPSSPLRRTTPTPPPTTIQTESEISIPDKPAIVITSPLNETSTNLPKIVESSVETNSQTTPTKFGIVFTSHHRHSTTTPSAVFRKPSTETSTSHETSKNDDEEMDDDHESTPAHNNNNNNNNTVNKNEQITSNTNTLKPPTLTAQPPLSDDETLNPETMQLSDLIGGSSRREEPKSAPSRSANKTTGKGKRTTKQETLTNKRQQSKPNTKAVQPPVVSTEKESVPTVQKPDVPVLPSTEQTSTISTTAKRLSTAECSTTLSTTKRLSTAEPATPLSTAKRLSTAESSTTSSTAKRLSTTESATISSPAIEKEPKRLRKSTDEPTVQPQIKLEPVEVASQWTNTKIKEEVMEPILPSEVNKQETPPPQLQPQPQSQPQPQPAPQLQPQPSSPLPPPPPQLSQPVIDQPQVTSMEVDQIPPSTSIITSTHSPSTTSAETENAIKALCSSIQIPQQTIPKTSNVEKSPTIIAPISKETLPIVEHQSTPITTITTTTTTVTPTTATPTTSIIPPHVSIKSSIPSTTFNEETLSAVNSLLMLNNNPPNLAGDHPPMKGTARVTPTISKPVYSFVTSLPSPTDQQSRQSATTTTTTAAAITSTTTTTSVATPSTHQNDLITMVSNIVSSANLNGDKSTVTTSSPSSLSTTTTTATTTRSHIESVIDDVAKGVSTTTAIVTEPTTSIVDTNPSSSISTNTTKSTSIPTVLRDVMKTPCLTSSTTVTTATTTTAAASETLNLFDSHRRSTSPLKTSPMTATTTTTTTNVLSTTATASSTPVVPAVVRPTSQKASTNHKRSSTPKADPPPTVPSPILHPFQHMLSADGNLFVAAAAAAHHSSFPFSIFGQLGTNPVNPTGSSPTNLLATSLVSSSPPLATRTSSISNSSSNATSHIVNNPFLNTIMAGQQNLSSSSAHSNQNTHEKGSRRDSVTKGLGTSSSSSNRSTPIQQTVPVPIALTIPSSSSSSSSSTSTSSSSGTTNTMINQRQSSPLLGSLDATTAAAIRQASPLQQFLGPDPVAPFRNVYSDPSELYGTPPGLYQPQNIAYAAAAQQMLNVMSITGSHHPFAAELYSNPESYLRFNPPTNELSRDPYNVQWQGNLILKNDQAYVKTQLVAGSPQIARASMNYWNSDSLSNASSNLQASSHHNLRISQRMRLEQAQLEGVQKRMQMDNDHCILIAEPNGSTPDEIRTQQNNLKNGVIRYFDEKKAAGIVNVLLPGASQPAYVVHIFPPCQFASEILQKRAPDTYRCVVQNKIEQIYLLIVITSTVQ
ncbi:unnamed protein product [Adineta steineri]|uniref:Msx2-interacting protein n=1 Tax=Adineta steineri TaxID=433720 RepID=A0A818MC57_9BILA|nr:unnamed protein product [Adineta steineri]